MKERIMLVDEQDKPIGEADKLKAHQEGLLHRAFSVFILRLNSESELELLLQQRQIQKYHSGGLWTNTCCSHPRPDEEDIKDSAEKRLYEEMGLQISLNFLGKFYYRVDFENGLCEHEWDYVFIGPWKGEKIAFNLKEVQDCKWIKLDELLLDLHLNPEKYTFWFDKALNFVLKEQDLIKTELKNEKA